MLCRGGAPLWDSRARTVPLEAGGDTGSRIDVHRGRDYRRAFGCDPRQRGMRIMTLLPPGVKVHLAFGYTRRIAARRAEQDRHLADLGVSAYVRFAPELDARKSRLLT